MSKFKKELENLINKYSMEAGSNTPDFILSEYLTGCLENFDQTLEAREKWYGRTVTKTGFSVPTHPLEIGTEAGWGSPDGDPPNKCEAPNCCCDSATGCSFEDKII